MLDIMLTLHQYVPGVESKEQYLIASIGETVPITTVKYHQILFGGDQLTCQRV